MGLKYRDPNTGSFKELTIKASDTLPIGSMVPYGNVNPPTGWLVCDGRAISRTVYADLFAVIGTSYGEGDGTTTFNLPNKKGRVSAGYDSTNSKFDIIGKKLGEETHTLSVAELATHTHHFTSGVASVIGNGISTDAITEHSPSTHGLGATDLTTTGNSQPFNVIQPTEVDQWIIKAFQSIGVVAKVAQTETENNIDVYSCGYINNKLSNLSKTSIDTGDTPPLNPSDGDLWIDTSDTANLAEVDNTVSTTSGNAIANKAITNYVNGLNTYSTTETIIGTWVNEDGTKQPLYRKIVPVVISNVAVDTIQNIRVDHNISNMKIGFVEVAAKDISTSDVYSYGSSGYINAANNRTQWFLNRTQISASTNRSQDNGTWYVSICYTKTTDAHTSEGV